MKNLKADVVIAGAGGAGVCAAVTAIEGHAKVIIFEKSHAVGANQTSFAGAIYAVESKIQHQAGENLTRDKAFDMFMEHVHWSTDARLVKTYIDKSADTIEWLEKHGIEFEEFLGSYTEDGYRTMHISKGKGHGHGGATIVKRLMDAAKNLGAEVYMDTPVKKILMSGDRIKGVIAEDKTGEEIHVDTGALIIATGGYCYNKEMIKKYDGFTVGHDLVILHKFKHITGDGIQMAWEIGAAAEGMGPHLAGKNIPGPGINKGVPWLVKNQLRVLEDQPYLWVNKEGKRFINEEIVINHPYIANAITRQTSRCAYFIFDYDTKKQMEKTGVDLTPNRMWGDKKIVDLDGQIEQCVKDGNENIFIADSLEDLANKMGVNPEEFLETVKEYNEYCDKGHDDLFGKNPGYLRPVRQPKFYGFKNVPIAYGTFGGIKINEKTEVLDKLDRVIHGIYAAGNDGNGMYGNPPTYNFKTTSGSALGFALNSGRIAGENVLKYIGK